MATPTVYKWTDADAPMPETYGSSSHYGQKYFLEILKACLVDGYGTKPAAGWTLEHWDETEDAYRAGFGNGNGIIECISNSSYGMFFALHESVTTWGVGNTDGTGGEGAAYESCWSEGVNSQCDYSAEYTRDNANSISSAYVRYYSQVTGALTDSFGWMVIATDKTFIIFLISNPDSYQTSTAIGTAGTPTTIYDSITAGAFNLAGWDRDAIGNFYLICSDETYRSGTRSTSDRDGYWDYVVGLKNPFGADKVASDEIEVGFDSISGNSLNYLQPLFAHAPIYIDYDGDANPDAYNEEEYIFGSLPGWRRGIGTYNPLLVRDHIEKYEADGTGRLFSDWLTIDGYECFPCAPDDAGSVRAGFISTDPDFWP